MKAAWLRVYRRLGHRGLFMLLLGAVEIIYGAGLLAAAGQPAAREHWWPASVGSLGGFPLDFWGTVWCLIGALCLATCWSKADRVAYAAAVLLNTGWSVFAIQRWIATGELGAWAPAAIYTGIAVGVFLVSGWPEVPKVPPPPDLPPLPAPPTAEELAALAELAKLARPPDEPP